MSSALSKAEACRPRGQFSLAPVVRSLAAAVLFPFDDVLRRMVAAGQGIEALCLFLGLTRPVLDDHLVRLALATPHDRPLRKPGALGWPINDTIRLIAWRIAGVHPEVIGERLGRSAGAVRAKARRLGLRAPPRKLLDRPDPKTLRDPDQGFGWRNSAQSPVPAIADPACSRLAGVVSFRERAEEDLHRQGSETAAAGAKIKGLFGGSIGQRELPLIGVVGGTESQPVKPPACQDKRETDQFAGPTTDFVIPKTEEEVEFNADLRWIGKTRRPLTNKLVVWICGMLMMGGLTYQEAAKRVGMTQSAFRTFRTRSGIPVDEDRRKFSAMFDERGARKTLDQTGYVLRQCITASASSDGKGNWFWVHKKDVGKTRLSPPKRKRIHQVEGRYNKISIVKCPTTKPLQRDIAAPFARHDGRNGCDRNSRSAAYA